MHEKVRSSTELVGSLSAESEFVMCRVIHSAVVIPHSFRPPDTICVTSLLVRASSLVFSGVLTPVLVFALPEVLLPATDHAVPLDQGLAVPWVRMQVFAPGSETAGSRTPELPRLGPDA